MSEISIEWRGAFTSAEANRLHAEAFETRVYADAEWDWSSQVHRHSLGWVTARSADGDLVGFVNVLWDGFVHAWLQDVMVANAARRQRVGVRMVHEARDHASAAGCEWLHVDFAPEHSGFYLDACGFTPSAAGLMSL